LYKAVIGLEIHWDSKISQHEIKIHEGMPFYLGRDTKDIRLNCPDISRQHCYLLMNESNIVLIDNNSTNGTMVNGVPVDQTLLQNTDVVRIGIVAIKITKMAIFQEEETSTDIKVQRRVDGRRKMELSWLDDELDFQWSKSIFYITKAITKPKSSYSLVEFNWSAYSLGLVLIVCQGFLSTFYYFTEGNPKLGSFILHFTSGLSIIGIVFLIIKLMSKKIPLIGQSRNHFSALVFAYWVSLPLFLIGMGDENLEQLAYALFLGFCAYFLHKIFSLPKAWSIRLIAIGMLSIVFLQIPVHVVEKRLFPRPVKTKPVKKEAKPVDTPKSQMDNLDSTVDEGL
jgi:pSer/pThr/pTyr-binding forkhead associated (FHA) protein